MMGLYIHVFILILFILPFIKREVSYDIYIIWGIYFLSSFLSLYYDPSKLDGFKRAEDYSDFYYILYGVLIFYALSPLYSISHSKNRPNLSFVYFGKFQKLFIIIGVLGGIFSIIYCLPYAIISLSIGAREIRSSVLASDVGVLPPTVLTTIAVAFASFFSVYIGLFFLSLKSNLSKINRFLLLLSSFSYVIVSLCFTARDGVLFCIIFSGIFLSNYWKTFTKSMKAKMAIIFLVVFGLGLTILNSFTKDRFGESSDGIMGYIATQPYVFAENIERRNILGGENFYGLSLRFPILQRALGNEVQEFDRYNQYEWTFGTFITDFYNVNGFFSLIIILIFFTEFFRFQFKNSKNNLIKFTLTYLFFIHYLISGVFYFRLGTFSGNVYILIMMFLIIAQKNKKKFNAL